MIDIKTIIEWNECCGNKDFNYHLENSMLTEEFAELIIALKNKDKREAIDGLLDILWVGIGTLAKMGLNSTQIEKAFEEIKDSNYSKLIFEDGNYIAMRDTTGKIIKPQHYKKPDLSFIEN